MENRLIKDIGVRVTPRAIESEEPIVGFPQVETASVKLMRCHPDAVVPSYAHGPNEDAGVDLSSVDDVIVYSGSRALIHTGWKIELQPGFEAQIRPRGGLAYKHGITVTNSPGTIDPGYRGEIMVILQNTGLESFEVKKGMRIAQMVIARYVGAWFSIVDEFSSSDRGEGRLASTGV
jgi:dUTP pyrophosphatase